MDSFESRMNPRFLAEPEKGMLWEPRVIELGRGTVEGFKKDEKGKRGALFCRRSVLADFPSSMFLCRLRMHWVLWWGCSLHWQERISGAVKPDWFAMISERGVVYRTKRISPSTHRTWAHRTWAVMVTKTSYWLMWTDICLRGMSETIGVQ